MRRLLLAAMSVSLAAAGHLTVAEATRQSSVGGSRESLPKALLEMAETEREFAATARVKGIRDSFLEFFADDAMFAPGTGLAKDQLRAQQPQPFSVRELVWEPRTGDVAASGELGWLTGPSTFINHAAKDPTPRYGNYLSVWRKEPNGKWRVLIDIGTNLKTPAVFPAGFTRFAFGPRYTQKEAKAAAGKRLAAADRDLNQRIASTGAAAVYAESLAPAARVHRDGVGALTDPRLVREWLDQHAKDVKAVHQAAESAMSAELGYSYGTYQASESKPAGYVRVWTREANGRWRLVADVWQPLGSS